MTWRRHRFRTTEEDWRPITFPPPGPYWCSGYDSKDNAILIAYLPASANLLEWWPEAYDDEFTEESEITFSDRFSRPEWWTDELAAKVAQSGTDPQEVVG